MSAQYIMGIDSGSQSTKVVIFDLEGNEMAYGSCALRETLSPEPDVVIHPDDDLWDSLYHAVQQCLDNFEGDKSAITGIGLCTIRCCRVLLDKNGELAYPVISWMDARMSKPYEHKDDGVHYVTTTSGYLGLRLTGEYNDTAANCEVFWPVDRETLDWSTDDGDIRAQGLTRDMLFNLVKPGEKLGVLRGDLASDLGLNEDIPVVATANDKAVEALGSGINEERSIMISLGTFISSMLIRDQYVENAQNFFPTFASIPFKYAYESNGIRRGLWTVSWFKNLIGEELTTEANKKGVSEEAFLNEKAKEVPVGSDGLFTILDWLASPDQPYRKGMMIGFDQRHTRYHMYRSILEAIAFNMKNNIDDMLEEMKIGLDELVVIGGGSKSDVMMQILADLFGLPVHRRVGSSSACLGAAICTTQYLGVYHDFESAAQEMVETETTFTPNDANHEFYMKVNEEVVKHIRPHTDEINKRIYPLFN
ncbi:FGGY-family carbohydrate kinase [Pontibacillus salipaludis]|uniref:Kinase n=1 Tax=Pontibacillus salipaludis TaxID=1697394 RepID=A0ABQ1Q214_9BACI|nr:FGGY family carbohydrate kinase [Pontibacillus salipaludis]GGD10361.1 kinase [Pontibacillus salipaludis]